jgi:hypothetical protein
MGITLTTALSFQAGHGEPAETLAEVKINSFSVDIIGKTLSICTQYGNTVGGIWVAGNAAGHCHLIENLPEQINYADPENSIAADPVYDILMGTSLTSAEGVSLYGEVGTSLYQVLLDKGIYEGTINV